MIILPNRRLLAVFIGVSVISAGYPGGMFSQTRQTILAATPVTFEPNEGQLPQQYEYVARNSGVKVFYLPTGMDISVPQAGSNGAMLRVRWISAKAIAHLSGEGELPGHSNYFLRSDASRWIRGVPQFARLRYRQIYPGIDMLFYGNGTELENDFLVESGADPSRIALRLDRAFHVTRAGDLEIDVGESKIYLRHPIAYQKLAGFRKQVSATYARAGNGEVKLRLGAYDPSQLLVIDPVFGFSTYLAGTGRDETAAITTDTLGNIYVTGDTTSTDFPVARAEQANCASCTDTTKDSDAFVSKFDPTGHNLLFSTYIGGSASDRGESIAIDRNGNVVVAGLSASSDFPHAGAVESPSCQINNNCFFAFSLTADGSTLNYSGLVGGSDGLSTNGFFTGAYAWEPDVLLALDGSGNAYIAGATDDRNFQLTTGTLGASLPGYPYNSAFVMKLDTAGKVIYSTGIPGNAVPDPSDPYANTFPPSGIAVDANGQVTLAGTGGIGLPATAGVLQPTFPSSNLSSDWRIAGYVLQLNASASALNYATYVPGTDYIGGVAVDPSGDLYLTGYTSEPNLPVTPNAYEKAIPAGQTCSCKGGFVVKLDGQGKSILAATYLAGTPIPQQFGTFLTGIALDSNSNVFVGGNTASADFPLQNPFVTNLQFSTLAESLVVAELNQDLSTLIFGSFLSSTNGLEAGSLFTGLAIDPQDNALVTGTTLSTSFPTTQNSFEPLLPQQNPQVSSFHAFIAKLDLSVAAPSVCFNPTSLNFGSVLVNTAATQNLQVKNCGNAPLQFTMTSSIATVAAAANCGSIDPGNFCTVQVTFSPTDGNFSIGTLTFSDNAAIPQQNVSVAGKGGVPQIFFPSAYSTTEVFVGTQGEFPMSFLNTGEGAWIVTSATANGDFSADNHCTTPTAPHLVCFIGILFTPTTVGLRTGTLTIVDNAPGSPHLIQLSGEGVDVYPTPSITAIRAIPMDLQPPQMIISGTNFFPTSQALVNGTPRSTVYGFIAYFPPNVPVPTLTPVVYVTLVSTDLAQPGELAVTVTNPAPGGGVSNSYLVPVYAAIRNLSIQNAVFEPNAGLLYASTTAHSGTDPGEVIAFNPQSGSIVSAWSVGNGPNQLAVSDDGQFLYVGLDGDKQVAQVSLPSGTINFKVGLGNDPLFGNPMVADALRVFPGEPHSWAVTLCGTTYIPCGQGVAVFDDSVERQTTASGIQLQADGLLFVGNDTSNLYGTTFTISPPQFYKFAINGSGVTLAKSVFDLGGGQLDTDGTSIYSATGEVIDPATLTVKSTIQNAPYNGGVLPGMKVDVPNSRLYMLGNTGSQTGFPLPSFMLDAFDLGTLQLQRGVLLVDGLASAGLFRWGVNGLLFASQSGVFILQTSLTTASAPPPPFQVTGLTPQAVAAGSGDLSVTISGSAFSSADTVSANGTALQITSLSATQIKAIVPAFLLGMAGDLALKITNQANQSLYLVLIIEPAAAPVATVSTNMLTFSPQMVGSTSTSQTVTITNQGSGALVIAQVSMTGTDFSQTNNCNEVSPGGNCSISVTFSPGSAGSRSGVVMINDNDVSRSQSVNLSGTGTDIQISAGGSSASATVPRGQPANYNLTLVPQAGFQGQVTFTCSNLPQYASCNINPASSLVTGASPINVAVTITTSQGQSSSFVLQKGVAFAGISWLALLGILPLRRRVRALRRSAIGKLALIMLLAATTAVIVTGCGGAGAGSGGAGSTAATPAQNTPAMTPSGNYTVNFVATSSGVSRTTPLTLIVQ